MNEFFELCYVFIVDYLINDKYIYTCSSLYFLFNNNFLFILNTYIILYFKNNFEEKFMSMTYRAFSVFRVLAQSIITLWIQ